MKRAGYVLYVFLIMIFVIPKEKIYYTFEDILGESHLSIANETISTHFFYLDAQNGSLLFDNQELANIEKIRLNTSVIYNHLSLSNVSFSPLYRTFFPGSIHTLTFTYTLLHPMSIHIEGKGDFGHCMGAVNLMDRKVYIIFDSTAQLRRYALLMYKLHPEKGGLVYETEF